MIIHDPPGSYTDVGSSLSFMSDDFGGGAFLFTNDSGITWSTLSVFVPPPTGDGEISCAGSPFTSCTVEPGQDGFFATLFFSGGPGIPNLGSFSIDLGSFGWTPDATFQAYANPEPGTFWLQHLTTQHHRERRGLNAQLRNLRFARAAAVLRAIRPKPRASACFSKTASRTRPAVVPSDLSSISPKARVASN